MSTRLDTIESLKVPERPESTHLSSHSVQGRTLHGLQLPIWNDHTRSLTVCESETRSSPVAYFLSLIFNQREVTGGLRRMGSPRPTTGPGVVCPTQ